MKIGLASDHRGYSLKEQIKNELINKNYEIIDYGTYSENSTDYPDYAFTLGENIRNMDDVIATRIDNDANIIAFGEKTSYEKAIDYVETFIKTPCSKDEKHIRRRNKIKEYEEQER